MSKQGRAEAVEIIADIITMIYTGKETTEKDRAIASSILNKLLRAGYLNDKVLVHVNEIQDEIDQAIFKCKVEE